MSGLLGGITTAARALAAQETGVQIAGRNLSNVNTPGYSRQRVVLGDRVTIETPLGNRGSGVEALGSIQIRDRFLDEGVTREIANSAKLTAQQAAFQRGEAALGEQIQATDSVTGSSSSGLSATLNDFFNGFDNLAANPTDVGSKQVLYQKATLLTDRLNSIDGRLATVQDDLTAQVSADTASATTVLKQIADLNKEIANAEIGNPASALDLRDQRQLRLEELSKYINFTTQPSANNTSQVDIIVKSGTGTDVQLVEGGRVKGPLAFDGTNLTNGTPPTVLAPVSGSIAGTLAARDGAIQDLRNNLRDMASTVASAVNTAYNPSGTTGNFFQASPPSGKLIALDPALTVSTMKATATGSAGANELALAVADVARQKFSTSGGAAIDGTLSGFLGQTVSGFGAKMSDNDIRVGDQLLVERMATVQRDAVSGVSVDEETTDLIKFQRAYEANARVIRTFDEMLDSLINMVN